MVPVYYDDYGGVEHVQYCFQPYIRNVIEYMLQVNKDLDVKYVLKPVNFGNPSTLCTHALDAGKASSSHACVYWTEQFFPKLSSDLVFHGQFVEGANFVHVPQ